MRPLVLRFGLATLMAVSVSTAEAEVAFDWATVGNPGNPADTEVMETDGTTGYGSVPDPYRISRHEVTNAQYCEFLNAVAATDTYDYPFEDTFVATVVGTPEAFHPEWPEKVPLKKKRSCARSLSKTFTNRFADIGNELDMKSPILTE